ncbi:MAG: VWA domain-containing protein [Immundisolibacteraceae bacterium]|nr:VWA domain-containing protein [Immundisolibacteraceae bacterium]
MIRLPILSIALLTFLTTALTAQPVDIVLTIDNSGSMKQNDPKFLTRDTVSNFVSQLQDEQRAGLLLFGTQARLISPLATQSHLAASINAGLLEKIDFRDQWTDTAAALEMALYELKMNGRNDAEAAVVILTDGIVDTGNAEDSKRRREWIINGLSEQAKQANVRIFAIAFTQQADYELLQSLGQRSSGDYYRIITAADLPAVFNKIGTQLTEEVVDPGFDLLETDNDDAFEAFAIDFADDPHSTAENLAIAEPSAPVEEIPVFSGRSSDNPDFEALEPPAATPEITGDSSSKTKPTSTAGHDSPMGSPTEPPVLIYGLLILGAALVTIIFGWLWRNQVKSDRRAPQAVLHDLEKISGKATIDITGTTTRIGRAPGRAHWRERPLRLIVDNPGISRLHATIEYRDNGYWLADQNSKNGCWINHERSRLPRKLQSGDKLLLAKTEFIFELPHPEEPDETILFGQ